ncbi:MAG: valine--pyruvate transaminase [Alkalispirochaeta sp.]
MQLSRFGRRFAGKTGVMDLMDDMGRALAGSDQKYMLGGGNPARIPEVEAVWRRRIGELLETPGGIEGLLGNYDTPQGQPAFAEALSGLLREEFGWDVGPENIGVTNGSQTAFFLLLNMFSGPDQILFPLLPEYVGYADQGIDEDTFVACRPRVERIDDRTHKYRVDFDAVEARLAAAGRNGTPRIGAICVSRPTNPSGNVLTDGEVLRLDELAKRYGIPLIIDNAYGMPFPHIVFEDLVEGPAQPIWNENIILGMSLSKIGLPGARTGIVVASPEVITALSRANAVVSLANTMVGQRIVEPLFRDRSILDLARTKIAPFYRARSDAALARLAEAFGTATPYSVHRVEGSIFLWLWIPDLPISSHELYERLKKRNVIVVPGEYFFFGDPSLDSWDHTRQCMRINYGQPLEDVATGIGIIAEEVRRL